MQHSQAVGSQDPAKMNRLYLYRPFVNAALVNGNFKTIVMLPKFVSVNEWVAINIFDFFTNINSFYGVINEFCTSQTCTSMSVGPGRDCLWIDQNRKQLRLPAPHYIDLVMSWVQGLVDDEAIFPTKSGRDFPQNFPSQIKLVYRLLLHVFAHIYHAHFQIVLHLKSEGHLNSLFAHYLAFGREFGLLDTKDLKGGVPSSSAAGTGPVAIGDLYEKWKELEILE
ncbi:Maintenance of ploidy protein mob2 [Serendipita indica DSM 11827]|uniref:Related to MOB2-required for maintenance in ploidy n=1 Tax=Serendipita indica (strain DSM 11827) TaxID=1109443 RepID=G4T931_SERID|nr:Maintenance of ploidy protein mob2 [Serendipita indica DSM 11827]CCA67814.1 related to MOB2-required for maintenance in ploidy [Serendipita indica DSM 11827]